MTDDGHQVMRNAIQ